MKLSMDYKIYVKVLLHFYPFVCHNRTGLLLLFTPLTKSINDFGK